MLIISHIGGSARVGIEAPHDIEVHREEVSGRIVGETAKPTRHNESF